MCSIRPMGSFIKQVLVSHNVCTKLHVLIAFIKYMASLGIMKQNSISKIKCTCISLIKVWLTYSIY